MGPTRLLGMLAAPTLVAATLAAQAPPGLEMRDLGPREHRVRDFAVDQATVITIDATGAEARDNDKGLLSPRGDAVWPAAAWILDARTRQVVWDLRTAATTSSHNGLRHFAGGVSLPAGVYELHYGSYPGTSMSITGNVKIEAGKVIGAAPNADIKYAGPYVDNGLYHQFAVSMRGAVRPARSDEVAAAHQAAEANVVVALRARLANKVERAAFSVDRNTTVDLTAVGEISSGSAADYGWIIDADTRRAIWRMDEADTRPAGGAAKNRAAHQAITLAPGRYVAYFMTDDSHDPSAWNAMPPIDPSGWGMLLAISNPAERTGFKRIDWEPVPSAIALASIKEVRNSETRSADFALAAPADVQVYALGEASGDEMVDYAWITNVDTHRRVWTMHRSETESAGGASKNREFDGVLHLDAGKYRVTYTSDDSHAYGEWNADAPAEPEYWGVSVWPASGRALQATPRATTAAGSVVLAKLTHIGNNVNAQVPFHLDADANVRVYAIGEGTGGDMDDYAWIEDAATGTVVWRMTYSMTEHAGGAMKNRAFDETIPLKAGRYQLHYKSDGSHAYGSWNDDPPDDPESWGVTLTRSRPAKP